MSIQGRVRHGNDHQTREYNQDNTRKIVIAIASGLVLSIYLK